MFKTVRAKVAGFFAFLAAFLTVSTPAWADTDAAQTGVTTGFGKIQAVIDVAIPLMFTVAAIVVAAMWGKRLLSRG